MSTYTERAALVQRSDLSPLARLLGLRILDMQGLSKGACTLSEATLAAELGVSGRAIRRASKELRAADLLDSEPVTARRIIRADVLLGGRTEASPPPTMDGQIRPPGGDISVPRGGTYPSPQGGHIRPPKREEKERESEREIPPTPQGGEVVGPRALIDLLGDTLRSVGKRPPPGLDSDGRRIRPAFEAHEGLSEEQARAWCHEWATDPNTTAYTVGSWAAFVTTKRNGGRWGRRRGTAPMQKPAPRSAFHEESVPVTAEDFINSELADVG